MLRSFRRGIETSLEDLKETLAAVGVLRTCAVIRARLADAFFDWRRGLDTARQISLDSLEIPGVNKKHGKKYQPTSAFVFRSLLRRLPLPRDSGFLDYGSGKGRVLLLAAEAGFRRVIGVEFSPQLCEIARTNVGRYGASRPELPPIEIVQADASRYVPAQDVGVFYFFNPFDALLMGHAIDRILDSLRRSPREAWLLLYNAIPHRAALEEHDEFALDRELVVGGYACRVYRYAPPSDPRHENSLR